jgi:iron complex outermembrane receptor protein
MTRTKLQILTTSAILALSITAVSPAIAQNAEAEPAANNNDAPNPNIIIVTARLREESLQDTPLSIQALTAEDLEKSGIADLSDIANFAPGLTLFENTDRGYGQVFLRGMSSTPPVGDTSRELASVFIDGIYYIGGVSGINTDNLERVEVVKGPQSALYGRSTFSGAINFITKKPGNEWSGNVSTTLATYGEFEASGSIAGPIVEDVLAVRVSGKYRNFDGQYRNGLNGQRLGQEEDYSVSGKIFFTPSDRFSLSLSASYLEQDDGAPSTVLTGKQPIHNFTSPSGRTFFQGVLPVETVIEQNVFPSDRANIFSANFATFSADPFTDFDRIGLLRNGMERDFLFTSWDAEYEFAGGYSLSYKGGYSKENAARLYDFELSREENYFGQRTSESDSHSHELRLASPGNDRLRWLVGAFYLQQDLYEQDPGGIFGPGTFASLFGIQPGQVLILPGPRVIVDLDIKNTALFASVGYDFTDQLSLSLEGRYQNDELETPGFPSQSTKAFLPRAILDYQASDDVLLYAVAAKGLRPSVINTQFLQRPTDEQAALIAAFPSLTIGATAPKEQIWSYEVGAKTTLLDGRAVFNVNAYYSDWSDRQVLESLLFDFGAGVSSTLVTIGGSDVEAYGIELQSSLQITPELMAGVNAAWNKTRLTGDGKDGNIARFLLVDTVDGQRLPQSPEISGTFMTEYRNRFGSSDTEYFLRGEAIYVGSRFASTLNLTETGDSLDINLRAGIDTDNFGVSVFVENLLQDKTFESVRSNADCATDPNCGLSAYEAVLPKKRQIGITIKGKF